MTEFFNSLEEMLSINLFLVLAVGFILILILFVLCLVLFSKNSKLTRRLNAITRGSDGESFEETLEHVLSDNQKIRQQVKINMNEIMKINENLVTAYRKIGVVKYNAYPGMAGKVSSCIALLNNENNGVVINSIHGQDGCYTYVREIMNGKSVNPLTPEDEEALKIALQSQP